MFVESRFSKLILRSHACHKDAPFHSGKWHKDSLEQVFVQNVILGEDEQEMQTKHHWSFQSCQLQTLMQKYRPMRIPHLVLPTRWYRLHRLQTRCEIFIQREMVLCYQHFFLDGLTLEDGTDRLSRNVGK